MNEILEKLISDEKRESEKLGEKPGKIEGAKEIAKTMIKEGLSTELIIRYTGLPEDIVAALQG